MSGPESTDLSSAFVDFAQEVQALKSRRDEIRNDKRVPKDSKIVEVTKRLSEALQEQGAERQALGLDEGVVAKTLRDMDDGALTQWVGALSVEASGMLKGFAEDWQFLQDTLPAIKPVEKTNPSKET